MPDITLCPSIHCPEAWRCYRAQAKPDDYQSYFAEDPRKTDGCEYFWPMEKVTKRDQTEAT